MKNRFYPLAFLLGFATALIGAAVLKQMGLPLNLAELTRVQAAAPPVSEPFVGSTGAGYSLDWYTLDGGGGQSAGGSYQMTATIGQPDAVNSAGGGFTLQGGFLPGTLQPWRHYLPLLRK